MYKPVFHRYLLIGRAYSSHRRLEREIWRFLCRQRQRQRGRQQRQTDKPIALPLAHACGVITNVWPADVMNNFSYIKQAHPPLPVDDLYLHVQIIMRMSRKHMAWCG